MQERNVIDAGPSWIRIANCSAECRIFKLGLKYIVPVDAERMLVTEAIVCERGSSVYEHRSVRHFFPQLRCTIF